MIKNPSMQLQQYNFAFLHSHYGLLYFEMLNFLSSNNTPREFPLAKCHLCSICTSNKNKTLKTINFVFSAIFCNLLWSKFWNHFQAEIIPWSPLFWDFLTVFHMVWKHQESCESWLVGFWDSRHSKMPKFQFTNFCIFELPLWIY